MQEELQRAQDGTVHDIRDDGDARVRQAAHRQVRHAAALLLARLSQRARSGSEDQSVYVWEGSKSAPLQRLEGHGGVALAVAAHPRLPVLASGAMEPDNTVRIWLQPS